MPSLDKINEYAASVSQQIRWKRAHLRVSEEITNHIVDGRDYYIAQGFDEETATDKAIADTGDSMTIGTQLDRIHRPKPQWAMFAWVTGFLIVGLFISLFIFDDVNVTNTLLTRRLVLTAIGVVVMMAAYFADFTILGKYPRRICLGVGLLVTGTYSLSGFGTQLVVLDMQFQLQALALLLPVVFAPIIFISRNKKYWGLLGCLMVYGLLCLVTLNANQLSGFVHFAIIGMALLIVAVVKNWFGINRVIGVVLTLVPYIIFLVAMIFIYGRGNWISARLMGVINPHNDPLGFGFLAIQARELLSNAVLVGEGVMPDFFPQAWLYSDFILSTIIIRFGWLAFAVVMSAVLIFMGKVVVRCMKQKSGLGFYVSIAVALTLLVQIFMYVVFNMGFTFTHISLPLISPGNSAMLINMALIGFMLSVFRTGDSVIDKRFLTSTEQDDFLSWDSGKLTINFKAKTD